MQHAGEHECGGQRGLVLGASQLAEDVGEPQRVQRGESDALAPDRASWRMVEGVQQDGGDGLTADSAVAGARVAPAL